MTDIRGRYGCSTAVCTDSPGGEAYELFGNQRDDVVKVAIRP